MTNEVLAAAVRNARQRHGHSYAQAADAIGVKAGSVVQQWELGGGVSAKNMPALAEYMDVSIEHLGALARGEQPPGRTDSDLLADLKRMNRNLERVTRKLIELDAENQRNAERLSRLEAAMIEALSKRI